MGIGNFAHADNMHGILTGTLIVTEKASIGLERGKSTRQVTAPDQRCKPGKCSHDVERRKSNSRRRSFAMLIVFGGLPGTGKTTISRELAKRISATWLRIDVIEHAIRAFQSTEDVGAIGYDIANVLAEANLLNGQKVVADCVNPIEVCRESWKSVAARAQSGLVQIEVVCTDQAEHRRRVETRQSDIRGLVLPKWQAVLDRNYEKWNADLVLDSFQLSTDDAVAKALNKISQMSN
jgi:predicted kinase